MQSRDHVGVFSTSTRWVIAAVSIGLLFAPIVAFACGVRGQPMENRAAVEFQGVEPGWRTFTELGGYLDDRLPLRSRAISADAWVDRQVFDEDPAFGGGSSPRVITGSDGFLFLADAVDNACAPHATPAQTVASLDRLASIIDASGRDIVTMVAPDKSSVHRELMPSDMERRDCFDAYTTELWGRLDAADVPGFVDLRAALQQRSQSSREPLYLRKDSHWDSAGSLVAVEAAIEAFAPGLWDADEVDYGGLAEYTGDLTGLRGNPEVDQAPLYAISRPDVTQVSMDVIDDIEGGFNRRWVNSAPDDRLIPGRTLVFLDSYGLLAIPQFVPFFEDIVVMRLFDYDPDRYVDLIGDADRVWFMTVERSASYRLEFEVGSTEFLDQLEIALGV